MTAFALEQGEMIASRFRIREKIGQGGMGAVFRAVQQPLGRDVAIKVIRKAADEPEMLDRFEEEAKAIAALRFPGIVTLYDFGHLKEGGLFLAMEYVEGQSLRQRLNEVGNLDFGEAMEIIYAVTEALAAAHKNDVVHRDLKPANVMLCSQDSGTCAKLVDFGLSCRLNADDVQRHTQTGVLMGTPGFIAPETATAGLKRDPRADLYALGVMWFEMLTGRPLFEADTPLAMVIKHTNETPPSPNDVAPDVHIPEDVEALIMRLLAKDPEKRPIDASALQSLLGTLETVTSQAMGKTIQVPNSLAAAPTRSMDSLSNSDLLHRTDKPVVVVLPFSNMSDDPSQEYFSNGITEDLITALSKFRSISVIARQTAFALNDEKMTTGGLADEVGASYALEGSVRKAGNQVRVSAQLIDVREGHQVWGQRYDRTLEDIFAVQDDVTQSIVAAVPRQLQDADMQRVRRKSSDNMAAYELFLAGRHLHHQETRDANMEATKLLERAIELDPELAQAWACLACNLADAATLGFADNPQNAFQRCYDCVDRAYEIDDQDSECHRILCEIRLIDQEWEKARFHHERALTLNPNDPRLIAQRGYVLLCFGKPDKGIRWIEEAMRLDPMHPTGYQDHLGRLLFATGRYEQAADAFRKLSSPQAKHLVYLAGCLAQLERRDELDGVIERLDAFDDVPSARAHAKRVSYRFTADRNHHVESLELAGL